MTEEHHRELHQFVKDRAGDAYRTAFHYEGDDWETLYVRDDLATDRLHNQLPDIVERARDTQALLREEDYPPLGAARATTEVHEDGVILHFPEGPTAGTLVSIDRDAARRLAGFVTRAMSILQSPSASAYRATAADD
ncbi:hypothetical protein [Halolamina salina]